MAGKGSGKKLLRVLKDKDTFAFLKYACRHPASLVRGRHKAGVPGYLNDLLEQTGHICSGPDFDEVQLAEIPVKLMTPNTSLPDWDIWNIRLAGTEIQIDIHAISWEQQFDDPEDNDAFHRFLWLYQIVAENIREENRDRFLDCIREIICSWIDDVETRDKKDVCSQAWSTYTVAERVSSWAMLLAVCSRGPFLDRKIIRSIAGQLDFIREHFEYFGERFTGNHLTNNGRGLYIAGTLLGLDHYADIGKKILLQEYDRVVTDGYFLREGSVHYQFLYTKWFADVYWTAAACSDDAFAEEISRRLERLSAGCRYFLFKNPLRGWDIPYIGDISPDLRPQWLAGVPWAVQYLLHQNTFCDLPKENGYHTFFLGNGTETGQAGDVEQIDIVPHPRDWGHIRSGKWEIFAHVNHSMYPNNLTGHFHHDSGGFVLNYNGIPLFTDCGRVSYFLDGTAAMQRNYTGHNLTAVDGRNPEIDMRAFYPEKFLSDYAGPAPRIKYKDRVLKMEVYGAERIRGIQKISRTISLKDNSVMIKDIIHGTGKHEITAWYHVPEHFRVTLVDGAVRLSGHRQRFLVRFSICPDRLEMMPGSFSSAYGKESLCSTVIYRKKAKVPFELRTEIKHLEGC